MFNEDASDINASHSQSSGSFSAQDELRLLKIRLNSGLLFQVNTPVTTELAATIAGWMECGLSGGVVYGEPRLGKTSGIQWALKQIPALLGFDIHYYLIPLRDSGANTESQFFEYLLKIVRHRYASTGNATVKRSRFTELLCAHASQSPTRKVVLAFDEAQNLHDEHYSWMVDLSNEMALEGCSLFLLQFGQTELEGRIKQLRASKQNQIVTRFMSDSMKFRGLASAEEIKEVLENLDCTYYPQGALVRFPERWLAPLYRAGFSLPSLSEPLWWSFHRAWTSAGLKIACVVPMHSLLGALIELFTLYDKNPGISKFSQDHVDFSVAKSAFSSFIDSSK
jgi:hypothetical protein